MACGVKRVFVSLLLFGLFLCVFLTGGQACLNVCVSLCFLCVIFSLRFLCVFAICNLFGVLSSLWMWKPGADRLRGNQSNKQEEACLPDNVFEQIPWICGILGLKDKVKKSGSSKRI